MPSQTTLVLLHKRAKKVFLKGTLHFKVSASNTKMLKGLPGSIPHSVCNKLLEILKQICIMLVKVQ